MAVVGDVWEKELRHALAFQKELETKMATVTVAPAVSTGYTRTRWKTACLLLAEYAPYPYYTVDLSEYSDDDIPLELEIGIPEMRAKGVFLISKVDDSVIEAVVYTYVFGHFSEVDLPGSYRTPSTSPSLYPPFVTMPYDYGAITTSAHTHTMSPPVKYADYSYADYGYIYADYSYSYADYGYIETPSIVGTVGATIPEKSMLDSLRRLFK